MNKENIIGFESLYNSMQKCKNGVLWKDSVAHYYLNAIEETLKLEKQLKTNMYKARCPVKFFITSPKTREIISVSFRDRVYQRSLSDNSIYPQMSKQFIRDNVACQKHKGTDMARNRLKCFMQKFNRKHCSGYVLQCDIRGYYPNMKHSVVKEKFRNTLDDWTYKQTEKVFDEQYENDIGFNPGSQMVQIAGISVLDTLDHFVKEELRIKFYIRYMDDFILIHKDKDFLEYCKCRIENELNLIGFEFNKKKTSIYSVARGIAFLGFIFKITDSGKIIMTLNPNNVKRERKKLRRLVNKSKRGEISKSKVDECYNGWKAHARKGNSYMLIQRMDKYYKGLW